MSELIKITMDKIVLEELCRLAEEIRSHMVNYHTEKDDDILMANQAVRLSKLRATEIIRIIYPLLHGVSKLSNDS